MTKSSRIESIFLDALDRPTPAERVAFLDRACGGDADLRRGVERLLDAHPRALDFLGTPALDRVEPEAGDTEDADADLGFLDRLGTPDDGSIAGEGGGDTREASNAPVPLGRLAHYEILEVLGGGGFGTVVKAFDEKLHRHVAIKLLAPILAASSGPRKQFVREARSAAAIRHENVIAIHAVEDRPIPHLVMEYVAGPTLQQLLDRDDPLGLPDVVRIGRQIATGLAAIHAAGLMHRDIKPANILIDDTDGRVKLTDFGLARGVDDPGLTQAGLIAGTPMYMAPEQANGEAIDHRADLFSLGCVLYAMACGSPPFLAANTLAALRRVREAAPRPIQEVAPGVPEWLGDLIGRLLARDPAGRIGSAVEVANLLEKGQNGRGSGNGPARKHSFNEQAVPRGSRRWRIMIAALVLLFAGMGLSEAIGVTQVVRGTVVRYFSPDGTLVVEIDDPAIRVRIAESGIVIQGAGVQEIRLKPGAYELEATRDGEEIRRELVEVIRNGRRLVRIRREPKPREIAAAQPEPGPDRPPSNPPVNVAWERSISILPAMEQVKAVASRLQELNPGFDGAVTANIEQGVVRGLEFKSDRVSDLAPIHALSGLRTLNCSGSDAFRGQLVNGTQPIGKVEGRVEVRSVGKGLGLIDLSPLKGLPLASLKCYNSNVYDLSPLAGMPLTTLDFGSTPVFDLSPLKGMPLDNLELGYTKVSDLTPLAGMRLTRLGFTGTPVSDLAPLKGMPLDYLTIGKGVSDLSPIAGLPIRCLICTDSQVADLSPLKGMPLDVLTLGRTPVTSLEPLRGVPTLKVVHCGDGVADLSPLRGLPIDQLEIGPLVTDLSILKEFRLYKLSFFTFRADRDAAILRGIPTLQFINGLPVKQFWANVDGADRPR